MAVYGYDLYGRSKYGPFVKVDYGVEPFVINPLDYTRTYLTWSEPVGPWDEFRLIRSRSGFVAYPEDGHLLLEFTKTDDSPPVDTHFLDHGLVGGWYYYTILLHSTQSDVWEVAAATSVLVPWDYNSTERLWDYLPNYYRDVRRTQTADFSKVILQANPAIYQGNTDTEENELMFKFLTVFGWGYDILRSQVETTLSGFDPAVTHVNRLALLADTLGATLPDTVPVQNNRNLVRNLALLYRKRGTQDGLRDSLALTSGWEVDVSRGRNLMLNRDQAAFYNPNIEAWDEGTQYVVGDIVRYNNYFRECIQNAYGPAQAPPLAFTGNAFWSVSNFGSSQIRIVQPNKYDTNFVFPGTRANGWEARSQQTHHFIGIGLGGTNPISGRSEGSLSWPNISGLTQHVQVNSVPRSGGSIAAGFLGVFDREDVVAYGVPVPQATQTYEPGKIYSRGELVVYLGATYEALSDTDTAPSSARWSKVGYTDRPRICMSFYAHGAFVGTAGTGGLKVYPGVAWFDGNGKTLDHTYLDDQYSGTSTTGYFLFYDAFTRTGNIEKNRQPDIGKSIRLWERDDIWGRAADEYGSYAYPVAPTRTFQGTTGMANGNVGLTYRKLKDRSLGLYFRLSDSSNFWQVTQNGLFRVSEGNRAKVADFTVNEGDRVTASFDNNSIIVYKNGTQVATTNDRFNSSATGVGMVAEAV